MESVGKTIRERRQQLGINQQVLADLAQVGINTIVAIERGKGNPSFSTLSRICGVLGLKIELSL